MPSFTPMQPDAKPSLLKSVRNLPFIGMALILLLGMTYLLFFNFHGIPHNSIVPEQTDPADVDTYLKSLSKAQIDELIGTQKARLQVEPLDRSNLLNLSVLYGLENNADKSNQYSMLAANRSLRDITAQSAAIDYYLARNDYKSALVRFDSIMRASPEYAKDFFPRLMDLALRKEAIVDLTNVLGRDPPWRAGFMDYASEQTDLQNGVYSILVSLREHNLEIKDSELRSYLEKLMKKGDFDGAYFVWLDFLSPSQLQSVGPIYDGAFTLEPRNLYFDWNILPIANADFGLYARSGKTSDRALKMQFSGLKGPFWGAYQYLRLDAGKYHFSSEYSASSLRTPTGLEWRIVCLEGSQVAGKGPSISGNSPMISYDMDVIVPATNCTTQVLKLFWSSTAILDQTISGEIIFDNIKLQKTE